MPVIRAAGIDPIYFRRHFCHDHLHRPADPPVGVVLNVVSGVARVLPLGKVIGGVWPFLGVQPPRSPLLLLLDSRSPDLFSRRSRG